MFRTKKIITRRRTVGFVVTPRRNADSSIATPRHTPPVPQLIPLKSALKMPSRPPFNVRGRKTMFGRINHPISGRPISSPSIPKGTTTQIIMNRIASTPASPQPSTSAGASQATVRSSDVTLTSPVGNIQMGRLNYSYSDSDDSEWVSFSLFINKNWMNDHYLYVHIHYNRSNKSINNHTFNISSWSQFNKLYLFLWFLVPVKSALTLRSSFKDWIEMAHWIKKWTNGRNFQMFQSFWYFCSTNLWNIKS